MLRDGVVMETVPAGVRFVQRVKSTRAFIALAERELTKVPAEDAMIIRSALRDVTSKFAYAVGTGSDSIYDYSDKIQEWLLAIFELQKPDGG